MRMQKWQKTYCAPHLLLAWALLLFVVKLVGNSNEFRAIEITNVLLYVHSQGSKWKFTWPRMMRPNNYYYILLFLLRIMLLDIYIYKAHKNACHNICLWIEFDFAAGFGFIYLYLCIAFYRCTSMCNAIATIWWHYVKNSRWLTNQNYIQNMVTCNEGKRVQMTTTTATDVYILMSRVRIRVDC